MSSLIYIYIREDTSQPDPLPNHYAGKEFAQTLSWRSYYAKGLVGQTRIQKEQYAERFINATVQPTYTIGKGGGGGT